MFASGNMKPDSMNTSRNPPNLTACIAAAWFGIAAPTIIPKATSEDVEERADEKGVGSPARRRPKSTYERRARAPTRRGRSTTEGEDLAEQVLVRRDVRHVDLQDRLPLAFAGHASAASRGGKIARTMTKMPGADELVRRAPGVVPEPRLRPDGRPASLARRPRLRNDSRDARRVARA